MNAIQITGNLGKDLEVTTVNGAKGQTEVGNFSIFVKEYKKGNPNAGFWVNVSHFSPNSFLKDTLKKGVPVAVSGRLDISKYNDNYYTKVISNSIDVFTKSGGGEESTHQTPVAEAQDNDLPF